VRLDPGAASDSGAAPTLLVVMATADATVPSAPARPVRDYAQSLWRRKDFVLHLARGNFDSRNSETTLGSLWWLINPMILSAVYFFIFTVIIKSLRSNFANLAFLIVGVLAFRFLTNGLTGSANTILNNAKLIVNLRFPRLVLPIAAVLESAAEFALSLIMLYVVITPASCLQASIAGSDPVAGISCIVPTYRLVLLPLILVLLTLFTLGIGALMAVLIVPQRDIGNLIPHLTRLWLYLSPVLWAPEFLDDVPAWLRRIMEINPMFPFLSVVRTTLINTQFEPWLLLQCAVWAVAMCALGIWRFARNEDDLARYL
jgi:teichoic acid transport system permease protein